MGKRTNAVTASLLQQKWGVIRYLSSHCIAEIRDKLSVTHYGISRTLASRTSKYGHYVNYLTKHLCNISKPAKGKYTGIDLNKATG